MQFILEQNSIAASVIDRTDNAFGNRIGIIGSIFGCWHKHLTRPFTTNVGTYRACLECGARRNFDPSAFKGSGPFYYPPKITAHPV